MSEAVSFKIYPSFRERLPERPDGVDMFFDNLDNTCLERMSTRPTGPDKRFMDLYEAAFAYCRDELKIVKGVAPMNEIVRYKPRPVGPFRLEAMKEYERSRGMYNLELKLAREVRDARRNATGGETIRYTWIKLPEPTTTL